MHFANIPTGAVARGLNWSYTMNTYIAIYVHMCRKPPNNYISITAKEVMSNFYVNTAH